MKLVKDGYTVEGTPSELAEFIKYVGTPALTVYGTAGRNLAEDSTLKYTANGLQETSYLHADDCAVTKAKLAGYALTPGCTCWKAK